MAKRPTVLTGTAGVYYVAYQLAAQGLHAALTHGNAPAVDILVARLDGAAMLSLQVKTSSRARRIPKTKRAKRPEHYEWDIGQGSATLCRPDLSFALVDLKPGLGKPPDVFIVPSKSVHDWFQAVITKRYGGDPSKLKRWMYHPKVEQVEPFKNENGWDRLRTRLEEKPEATETAAALTKGVIEGRSPS